MFDFREGLFKCHKDVPSCLIGCCVPGGPLCLQASAVNRIRGQGCCIPYCIASCGFCIGGAVNRERIREGLGYERDFWRDSYVWMKFGACAGCQEYREVKNYYKGHQKQ